jgi:hypothetical protein
VPREERGPGRAPEVSPPPGDSTVAPMVPDWQDRRAALDRLQAQEDQRRIATWLHRYAPLTDYYRARRWAA